MEKAAMIFNGIYFSYPVIDEAFAWAKNTGGNLIGIFLCSKKETGEGYIYPSDLDAAEEGLSDAEAEQEDENLLQDIRHLITHRADSEHIILETTILHDPSEQELSDVLRGCVQIFVQENIQMPGNFTVKSIRLEKYLPSSGIPLQLVKS